MPFSRQLKGETSFSCPALSSLLLHVPGEADNSSHKTLQNPNASVTATVAVTVVILALGLPYVTRFVAILTTPRPWPGQKT